MPIDMTDTWEEVFENIIDNKIAFQRKQNDQVTVELSKSSKFMETFVPDFLESVRVALEFDEKLKYVKFIIDRPEVEPENQRNRKKCL